MVAVGSFATLAWPTTPGSSCCRPSQGPHPGGAAGCIVSVRSSILPGYQPSTAGPLNVVVELFTIMLHWSLYNNELLTTLSALPLRDRLWCVALAVQWWRYRPSAPVAACDAMCPRLPTDRATNRGRGRNLPVGRTDRALLASRVCLFVYATLSLSLSLSLSRLKGSSVSTIVLHNGYKKKHFGWVSYG